MLQKRRSAVRLTCPIALAWLLVAASDARFAEAQVVLQVNPYEGIDWDRVERHKANLHTHTTQSDGRLAPDAVIDEYRSRGYTVLALTDHDRVTYPWRKFGRDPGELGMLAIVGNELSRHHHTLSLFCDFVTDTRDWNAAIEGVGVAGGVAVIAHPAMHWPRERKQASGLQEVTGVPDEVVERYAELFRTHPHLLGQEVLNGTRPLREYPLDRELWDKLLAKLMPDRPVWGFATDDMHSMTHLGRDWIVVLTSQLSEDAVRDAITRGAFFFASIRLHEAGSQSVEATPRIERVDHDVASGIITVTATEAGQPLAAEAYQWIADGKTVQTGPSLNYRATPGIGAYVRVEITGGGGTVFTNPFGLGTP
ncbi:MAG: hypothetical protein U1E05_00640 [Patescibacteria group bacterium]|nr:hypothetical protein [Patescibacteria group bacterium]